VTDVVEYVLLGLALSYTIVAFYEYRAKVGSRLRGVLEKVRLIIPFVEGWLRRFRKPRK
jgi:hypothetical protein